MPLDPEGGESCWDLVNDDEREWYGGDDDTGYGVPPILFVDDARRHIRWLPSGRPIKLSGDFAVVPAARLRLRMGVAWGLAAAPLL